MEHLTQEVVKLSLVLLPTMIIHMNNI